MTTREGPRDGNPEGHGHAPPSVPGCPHRCPHHDRQATEAAAWRSWWTEDAIRERLREDDMLMRARMKAASLDVGRALAEQPPPEPWPKDARITRPFYPARFVR